MPREAAAVVILRRKQQSINGIAKFLGRSTSFIARILKANGNKQDLRKYPTQIKQKAALRQWKLLEKLRLSWDKFILSEVEKPP
jgi:IS30 family transposase